MKKRTMSEQRKDYAATVAHPFSATATFPVKRGLVQVPLREYRRIHARIDRRIEANEDRGLARMARQIRASADRAHRDALPADFVRRIIAGQASPLRAWREHRGMSGRALAATARIPPSYLSNIENDKKPGTVAVLKRVAAALGVELADIA